MIKITPEELTTFSSFIQERSGIVLDQSKSYLFENRLAPLLEKENCPSFEVLLQKCQGNTALTSRIIDALSTNETSFFRDRKPFEALQFKILPDILDRRENQSPPQSINIWSAASSTGQEVYSIAMVLHELLGSRISQHRIKITGTDISETALSQASRGKYSQYEADRGLSPSLLTKYFHKDDNGYRVRDELRSLAHFQKINLLGSLAAMGKFDVIFCRNVAYYFSEENKKRLFANLAQQLTDSGVLIIGATETLFGMADGFVRKNHHNAVYYQLP